MNRRHGYSLLEVLIALTILMIGIIAVYRLFPISMREARMAEEKMIAAELADSRLGRLRASGVTGPTVAGYAERGGVGGVYDYTRLTGISAAESAYTLYESYATILQRMRGAGGIHGGHYFQRALFTVRMPDGRDETFVTYVVEQ